ncbi:hypothetical protein AB0383_20560 [Amycolatopsis sp. NPDC051373]|uniref:hypothetical protein n=1 Tax=Amycolatopsis sp. NPDC051373 TaxID=3155801 RepID=UPI00344B9BF8
MVWEDAKYRAGEVARLQPEQTKRAPGKKDRKKWCRGKEGVPHVVETRFERWAITGRHGFEDRCGWFINHRTGKPMWYSCAHEDYCTNCGRIMSRSKSQCPDYTEPPEA